MHIVTVNDYLAKRDSEWMGKVYRFLGLTVGLVIHDIQPKDRKASYSADITYGTNNEFGFDYLRDNMAIYATEMVQRGHAFAIVDEVDSILIDEARTPLIISGQGDKSTQLYTVVDAFVAKLKGQRVASVDTRGGGPRSGRRLRGGREGPHRHPHRPGHRQGRAAVPGGQPGDPENTTLSHHINQAIRARGLMRRDIDYVVKDGEVIIVDEFTGRLMYGRRYSEGLHQAIEAKEGVTVARESKTLATITFQNYFRLYGKLSGMTGTAMTEEEEFGTIYSLDIVEIPTNKPVQRVDHPDVVYKTEAGKFRAIVNQIEECHKKGQPVLVGTISIEKSEELSAMLKKRGIRHNVLNAKFHEKEAEDRCPGRQAGRGHRGHQHGRPRHRYHAGRQRRVPGQGRAAQGRPLRRADRRVHRLRRHRQRGDPQRPEDVRRGGGQIQGRSRRRPTRCGPRAACSSWAPSATSPAASTTSSAAVPAVRATRARAASICPWRTTSCACSAPSGSWA